MRLSKALRIIYSSYESLDELANPFKLYSRLSDYMNESLGEINLAKEYRDIIEYVNMPFYIAKYDKEAAVKLIYEDYKHSSINNHDLFISLLNESLLMRYDTLDSNINDKDNYSLELVDAHVPLYRAAGEEIYHRSPNCSCIANKDVYLLELDEPKELMVCSECKRRINKNHSKLLTFLEVNNLMRGRSDKEILIRRHGKAISYKKARDDIFKI